jgi:hypothetical protein
MHLVLLSSHMNTQFQPETPKSQRAPFACGVTFQSWFQQVSLPVTVLLRVVST